MNDVATLGIGVDSRQVKEGASALDNFATKGKAAEVATKSLTTATDILSDAAKKLGLAYAAYKVVDYIKDASLLNARYETLGISMTMVGKNVGYTANQMEQAAQGMQKMGISMVESRNQAMRLVQAHIDLAQSQQLARIAQDAAVIGNMNSSEAFATMIHGIQTGQTDVLRTIGLNISMEQSYKVYAATLGKTANQLTQNEKTQAVLNAVMLAGKDIAGTYEAAMGSAGKQLNSMTRYLEDLKVKQGEVFNEALTVAVMAFTDHLKDANGEIDELAKNGQLTEWGRSVTDIMVGLADNVNNLVGAFQIVGKTVGLLGVYASVGALSAAGRAATDAYKKDVEEILLSEDRFGKALIVRRASLSEKAAKDAETKRASDVKATAEYYVKLAKLDDDYFSGKISGAKYQAGMDKLVAGDNHKFSDTVVTPNAPKALSPYQSEKLGLGRDTSKLKDDIAYMDQFHRASENVNKDLMVFETTIGKFAKLSAAEKKQLVSLGIDKDMASANKQQAEDFYKFEKDLADKAQQDDNQRARQKYDTILNSTRTLKEESVKARNAAISDDKERAYAELDVEKQKWIDIISLTEEASAQRAEIEIAYQEWLMQKTSKIQKDSMKTVFDTVEKTGHDAFYAVFTRDGTSAVQAMGKAIQSSIIDILYQMTMKKWVLNIATEITGDSGGSLGGIGGFFSDLFGGGDSAAAAAGVSSAGFGAGAGSAYGSTFDVSSLASFDVGTDYVPFDMVAKIHKGEKIIPATQNTSSNHGANITVNVIEAPGKGGQQEQRNEGGANIIDVFVEQIEAKIASGITRGSGPVSASMVNTFGLNRAAGNY